MKVVDPKSGQTGAVGGIPQVAYGGQGGLADFIFAPDYTQTHTVYLSWAEAGDGGNKGGAVGRGMLYCPSLDKCEIDNLKVIWRQQPKVGGVLQYALRMTFSPDGKYLFVSSGDRVAIDYVQKTDNNLGKIVRLLPDGSAAPGNPFAGKGSPADQIWTIGHRNPLGLQFDLKGQLWDLEHGPMGGDEINKLDGRRQLRLAGGLERRQLQRHADPAPFDPPRVPRAGDQLEPGDRAGRVHLLLGQAVARVEGPGDRRRP